MAKKTDIWANAKVKQTEKVVRDYEQKKASTPVEMFPIENDKNVIDEKKHNSKKEAEESKELTNHSLDTKLTKLKKTKVNKSTHKKIKKESPFNKKGWSMIVASLIMMVLIIAVPLAFLFGAGTSAITGRSSLYMANGFTTEKSGYSPGNTLFSLEHIESGKFIDMPYTNVNEKFPLSLTDSSNEYNFAWKSESEDQFLRENDLALTLAYQPYFLVSGPTPNIMQKPPIPEDTEPEQREELNKQWEKEVQIDIYKNGAKDEYAIFSKSQNQFLGNPDDNNQLTWSTEAVWWKMKAEERTTSTGNETLLDIATVEDFEKEFWDQEELMAESNEFISGMDGRTMSIQSATTDKYLNTEGFIDEFTNESTSSVVAKQSDKKIELQNYENSNFFVQDIIHNKIQIGAFSSNTVDKRTGSEDQVIGDDWFPVLVADGDELKLETRKNEGETSWSKWDASFITLEKNPLNLREFAINFKDIDGTDRYVTTRNDYVHIEHGDTVLESNYIPEYFRFNLSSLNAENIDIRTTSSTGTSGTYTFSGQDAEDNNIYKVKIRARAYDPDLSIDDPNSLIDDTGWKNYKVIGSPAKVKISGLERSTTYNHVEMQLYRDSDSGNHITTYLVDGFTTIDWDLPDIPEGGDGVAINNHMKEIEIDLGEDDDDGPANNAKVEVDFENGEGLNMVTRITLTAYPLDDKGNVDTNGTVVKTNEIPGIDPTIEFEFNDLEPDTPYWITTKYRTVGGSNQEEKSDEEGPDPEMKGADSGIYSMTIRTHRTKPAGKIDTPTFEDTSGFNVLTVQTILNLETFHTFDDYSPLGDIVTLSLKKADGTPIDDYDGDMTENVWEKKIPLEFSWDRIGLNIGDEITLTATVNMQDYIPKPYDSLIYDPGGTEAYEFSCIDWTVI